WFTLGCTTRRAAIAANTGSCPGTTRPARIHAVMVATTDFTICSSGARFAARTAAVIRMPTTLLARLWHTDVGRSCLHGRMQNVDPLRAESRATWASVVCFLLGLGAGLLVMQGAPRPLTGPGGVGFPVALVAGAIAGASF